MQNSITSQDQQTVIFNAIITNAFNALADYTGWPISHINEILERYTPDDNMDYLGDLITDLINGNPQQGPTTMDFYLNSDDMLLQDAYLITEDSQESFISNNNCHCYTEQDAEHLQHFYTDPILNISFNIFID